ncbi:hypothetical protein Tco_0755661 [Tanacetum coccineum]
MVRWKPKDLKNKSFANIHELIDKAMKRVNTFVDFRIELVEGIKKGKGSEKRAGDELEQENAKKQKVDVEKETEQEKAELQSLMEIVFDEEDIEIDAIPLATKPPSIIDWKILTKEKKSYYQIIRAGGQSKRYLTFLNMLKDFDKEDLETMWKLMKHKHGSTRPEKGYERVLWCDLKTMFELNVEDEVWKIQQMMDDPNMTMEEYIKLEEEKAHRRSQVFNWQTTTYGKIRVDDDLHDLSYVEAEFPAIVINDAFAP